MEIKRRGDEHPVVIPESRQWGLAGLDIVLFMVLFLAINTLLSTSFGTLFKGLTEAGMVDNIPLLMINETLMFVAAFVAVCVVLRIRKMPITMLGLSFRPKDLIVGMVAASFLMVLGFSLSLLLRVVLVEGARIPDSSLLMPLMFFLLVSVTEEFILRGFVLGRLLDGGVGKYKALLISSFLFSLMHLLNPNFAFLPFLNILLAGVMLGASCLYTRNIWFPIGLHWFWNWVQTSVLGYNVSGNKIGDSLLVLNLSGDPLLSGGAFGFEGSICCTFVLILGTIVVIKLKGVFF